MAAHITVKLAVVFVQVLIMMLTAQFLFGIRVNGSIGLALLILLVQGFAGICFGLTLSAVANNESEVILLGVGYVFPTIIISALIWPFESLPYFLRYISLALPLTLSTEAFRSVVVRGWLCLYPSVWLGLAVLLGWSFLFNLITLVLFQLKI